MNYRTKKIIRRDLPEDAARISRGFPDHIPSLIQRLFMQRGVYDSQELDLSLNNLAPPVDLLGVAKATALLVEMVETSGKVLIVGDYDTDGATSTALAVCALRSMGLNDVAYLVPNRFEFGYGLSPKLVELAAQSSPDLIVTVDNGIASVSGVYRAKQLGIRVLVTDHHLPGDVLPEADAIVNPNQQGCGFVSKNAAGVAVIFYVMCALRSELRNRGWFAARHIATPNMANLLDLVALGTVADVVKLDYNNRVLVTRGIERIRAGKARPGIMVLLKLAGKDYRRVVASDLGFSVGPRLNAAGRLDDIAVGVECLLADDWSQAETYANVLNSFNEDRKQLEQDMLALANTAIENLQDSNSVPWGITLFNAEFHQGVTGLVASRVKDRLNHPVVVFAEAEERGQLKGSCRSIPGLHIRDVLDRVATSRPGVIIKFGGHAMAAGLTIQYSSLSDFSRCFDQVVRTMIQEVDLQPIILTDGELTADQFSLQLAEQIRNAAPWGQGFPEPLFDGVFLVESHRVVGFRHLKLTLRPVLGSTTQVQENSVLPLVDAIQFGSPWVSQDIPRTVRAAFKLDANYFRGKSSLQLLIDYLEPCQKLL
ncbi:MAG: single-stranded-DNA-specific exonuclease RecJ [Gammaproteobacteria bacterium]|nr:MAG: single-stranded-DNA-specific exonuclease RecJ [Gammaproteobacteria bacterium]